MGATGKVWERFPHRDWGKTPLTPTAAVPQPPQNSNSGSNPAGPARPRFAPNREKTGKSQFPGARDSQNRRFPPQKGAGLGRKELILCPNPAAPPPAAQSFPFFQAPSLTDLMDAPSKFHFFFGRGRKGNHGAARTQIPPPAAVEKLGFSGENAEFGMREVITEPRQRPGSEPSANTREGFPGIIFPRIVFPWIIFPRIIIFPRMIRGCSPAPGTPPGAPSVPRGARGSRP